MMRPKENTAYLLKKYRTKRGYNAKEASIRCGLVIQQYSNLENGSVKLGPKLARKIVKGLGIPRSRMVNTLLKEYKTKLLKNLS